VRHAAFDVVNQNLPGLVGIALQRAFQQCTVLLDRGGSVRGEADPLAEARALMAQGHSLILFPEGTRGSGALPGPFRSGLYHLARACPQAELVPVYLANLARAYPKGAILPAPITCTALFGAPIRLSADEPRATFLARARQAVCALAPGAVQ